MRSQLVHAPQLDPRRSSPNPSHNPTRTRNLTPTPTLTQTLTPTLTPALTLALTFALTFARCTRGSNWTLGGGRSSGSRATARRRQDP
jgi:hypothetical protein